MSSYAFSSLFSSTPWPRHPQVQPNKDLPPPSQPRTRHRYPLTTAQVTIWVLHSCAKAAPLLWTKSSGNLTHYLQNCTKPSLTGHTMRHLHPNFRGTETTWKLSIPLISLTKLLSLLRLSPATVYQTHETIRCKFLLFHFTSHFSFYDHKLSHSFSSMHLESIPRIRPSQSPMKSKFCICVLRPSSLSGLYVLSDVQCEKKVYIYDPGPAWRRFTSNLNVFFIHAWILQCI